MVFFYLMKCMIYRNTTVIGNVQLPAHLPNKTDPEQPNQLEVNNMSTNLKKTVIPERSDLVARHPDHLVCVEGEAVVVQGGAGKLRQDVARQWALQ